MTLEYVRHGLSPEEAAARADAAVLPDAPEETRRSAEVEAGGFARGNARWFSDQAGPQGLLGRLLRPLPAPEDDDSRAMLLPAYPQRGEAAGSLMPLPRRGEEDDRVALDEDGMHESLRAAFDARFGAAFVATGDVAAAREMALRQAADEVLNGAREGSEADESGDEAIDGEESDETLAGNLGDAPYADTSLDDRTDAFGPPLADDDVEELIASGILKPRSYDHDEEIEVAALPAVIAVAIGVAAARALAKQIAGQGIKKVARKAVRSLADAYLTRQAKRKAAEVATEYWTRLKGPGGVTALRDEALDLAVDGLIELAEARFSASRDGIVRIDIGELGQTSDEHGLQAFMEAVEEGRFNRSDNRNAELFISQMTDQEFRSLLPKMEFKDGLTRADLGDLAGRWRTLQTNRARHIVNEHGPMNAAKLRRTGQLPVSPETIALTPEVLQSPDKIVVARRKGGRISLEYHKKVNGHLVVAEFMTRGSSGLPRLLLQTFKILR